MRGEWRRVGEMGMGYAGGRLCALGGDVRVESGGAVSGGENEGGEDEGFGSFVLFEGVWCGWTSCGVEGSEKNGTLYVIREINVTYDHRLKKNWASRPLCHT